MDIDWIDHSILGRGVSSAFSYINNKGEHPKIGKCILPKKVIFGDVKLGELKDDEWKLCMDTSETRSGIKTLIIFDDVISIINEEYLKSYGQKKRDLKEQHEHAKI